MEIHFKPIDDTQIQVKGGGANKIFKTYSGSKVPGSFLLRSKSMGDLARVFCIFDYTLGWQFGLSPVKEFSNLALFGFYITYQPPTDETNTADLVISVPVDTILQAEGEFSD